MTRSILCFSASLLALLSGLVAPAAAVQRVAPEPAPAGALPAAVPAVEPLAGLAGEAAARPLAVLPPAAEAAAPDLAALAAWNQAGKLPVRNGIVRALPERRAVRLRPGAPAWVGALRVAGAFRLRAHLAEVALPAGTRMWVAGADGERFGPFGLGLLGADRGLWTPSVGGGTLVLEVELPAGAAAGEEGYGFVLDQVVEIVGTGPGEPTVVGPGDQSCFRDGACITAAELPAVGLLRRAVAHLQFVDRRGSFVCSGGLLADSDEGTAIPYLLSAYHCFPFEESALSAEAFWDYAPPACGGTTPALGSLPRSVGAALLANGPRGDYALLRLASVPPGRAFLGWDADPGAAANGTVLHRLSHPRDPTGAPLPQTYAAVRVSPDTDVCLGAERGPQIYSQQLSGGVFGGSSGAPAVTAAGLVVGQLSGGCGPNAATNGCDPTTAIRDGAFATSFPALARFLDPSPGATEPCVPGPHTLCLGAGGRFRVEVVWRTRSGASGVGSVVPVPAADSGLFWFFGSANWEMLVKVLDGCIPTRHYWVYAAATTDVEYRLTVTDTRTGQVKRYSNPLGQASPAITDTKALPCP